MLAGVIYKVIGKVKIGSTKKPTIVVTDNNLKVVNFPYASQEFFFAVGVSKSKFN